MKLIKNGICGFTLVELLVALTIMVVIGAVVVPSFFGGSRKAKDQTALQRASLLDVAKNSFIADRGKNLAKKLWAQADALPGYEGEAANTNDATSCEFVYKGTNEDYKNKLSQRDEAKPGDLPVG